MAIAEMSSMTLVALLSDKEKIYDALQKTGAAQIKSQTEKEFAAPYALEPREDVRPKIERANKCLDFLLDEIETLPKNQRGEGVVKDGFGVTTDEFFQAGERLADTESLLTEIERAISLKSNLKSEISKIREKAKTYEPYLSLKEKFSTFADTKKTRVFLGIIPSEKVEKCFAELSEFDAVESLVLGDSTLGAIICVVAFKQIAGEVDKTLVDNGFQKCPFREDKTASQIVASLNEEIADVEKRVLSIARSAVSFAERSKEVKVYADYLAYLNEKRDADGSILTTEKTFVLEAYVPTEKQDEVRLAVERVAIAREIEFKVIPRDQFAPTLMKNKKAVENFEAVTNMYSVPAYGALDPNAVMSFFFSLFMGLIMGDFGYGLLMIIGGFLLASKQRDGTSLKRMANVFAYGGFFALLFGALFDSWFGYPLLRTVFGADSAYALFYAEHLDAISAPASIMGISVPKILLWCLALGIIQIAASLVMKAVQCFSRKQYADGIFSGLTWAIGLVAFVVAAFGLATDRAALTKYGGYIAIGFIVLGVLTAGITEKGFGKIVKPFASVYGLINYASDILSYARLYGLMLSGAQIASIFTNNLAIELLFPVGPIGVFFGVIVIIVGNLFNVAMSLLGAYIHDSRLQYVEFFGRFYEGEGELFTPLGSSGEHLYVERS